jgi:hypothetical protein
MSCVLKLYQKVLEVLDNVDLDDLTQSTNSSSTHSSSSSDGSGDDDCPNSAAKPRNHDSNTEERTPKCRKVEAATTRVKKSRGPGKKNKSTNKCHTWLSIYGLNPLYTTVLSDDVPKWMITYHLSISSSKQMGKPKKNQGDPRSDFL